MDSQARVTTSYQAQYADPIAFEAGDLLTLTGRSDNWNGHTWLWAVAAKDGREGWIPDTLVDASLKTEQPASVAYNALELTCREGEELTILDSTHGWHLCQNQDGRAGWVPGENLELIHQH
ncbi:MAG: hypothetical protein HRU27_15370 [Rhizobiaceae bacterium]|nr:SH3 domain-containing protein [Hyphomicrobiales bacterium]NRB31969.1 hypothetical protein [Rhizobiaceae bacterium]